MATLTSPGVAISVIDESMYVSAGNGTVPLIAIATAANKFSVDGSTLATGTQAANQINLLTSQRDLLIQYGKPQFKIVDGTPVHGYETNEYGLHAAYSYLGLANRAYVVRADIDLAQLDPSPTEPTSLPAAGTVWLDTSSTRVGLFISNAAGSAYGTWDQVMVDVTMESDVEADMTYGFKPKSSYGAAGDYAWVPQTTANLVWFNDSGTWKAITTANSFTVHIAPHYQIPTASAAGEFWFKTTSPNHGFLPAIKKYIIAAGQVVGTWQVAQTTVLAYANDTAANADGQNFINNIYAKTTAGSAAFELRIFTSSGWADLVYEASDVEPTGAPVVGTLWYNDVISADLYRKGPAGWVPISPSAVYIGTDAPSGPTLGDIWIDSSDMENFPIINEYDGAEWVTHNNADQTTPNGVIFADLTLTAGDASNGGAATRVNDNAPDPLFHPTGMLCWNAIKSTGDVKMWNGTYWASESGNYDSGPKAGAPYMLRKAQRRVVVKRLQAVFQNEALADETIQFTLIAAPGYPECIDEMINLNVERKETAFIVGDTPLRLNGRGTAVQTWALGTNAGTNGEDGLVTRDTNVAIYYPSCLATDLDGNDVVVPPSHAVLRTYAYNDQVAYPWFAPAGLQRGNVSNVSNFGYVSAENEFVSIALSQGQRDSLYTNSVNPLVNFPGQGLFVFGQKTLHPYASALDRVNVARLVCYLRSQFEPLARPFIFEPNDKQTRTTIRSRFNDFLTDLISKRALYDFLVVCDETNNTPARIDRNELYVDVAIAPVKAAEFIYIPIRVVNTGAIGNTVTSANLATGG
jgi:Phage tail sheath C-terminal domain